MLPLPLGHLTWGWVPRHIQAWPCPPVPQPYWRWGQEETGSRAEGTSTQIPYSFSLVLEAGIVQRCFIKSTIINYRSHLCRSTHFIEIQSSEITKEKEPGLDSRFTDSQASVHHSYHLTATYFNTLWLASTMKWNYLYVILLKGIYPCVFSWPSVTLRQSRK